jgi:hypothetical protein
MVILRLNRRTIEFCELLALFRSTLQCALCSVAKCTNLGVYTSKYLNQGGHYGHLRQYRRRTVFCQLLGLFRSIIQCALCSDRKKNLFRRLSVQRSPTGRKLRTFVDNVVERLRFARFWAFAKHNTACTMS